MTPTILAIGFFILFLGVGERVCRLVRVPFESLPQQVACCGALGMGLTGYGVLVVGLTGGMRFAPLAILCGVLFLIALAPAWKIIRQSACAAARWISKAGPVGLISLALALGALLLGWIGALGPEIGNDALCYHLNCPRLFLLQGRIGYIPYDANSHYPFLLDNLFGVGLAFQGPQLAKMFHWMTSLFAAIALTGLLRRDMGVSAGIFAAAIFLLIPGVLNESGIAYVEGGLVLFCVVSLASFVRFLEERRMVHAALAGCFLGFSLSVKNLAGVSAVVMVLIVLGFVLSRKARGFGWGSLAFIACAFVFSAFWYLKSYWVFGNPVHPFYGEFFGKPFMPMSFHQYDKQGMGNSLLHLLTLPWNVTLHPERFGDFGDQAGPMFLAFSPALIFVRRWSLRWKVLGVFALLSFLMWFYMGQLMRFAYVPLAVLSVLTAGAILAVSLAPGFWNRVLRGMVFAFLALELLLGFYHYRHSIWTFWSSPRQAQYLAKSERTFELSRWINANLPPDAKILNADEVHAFYIRPAMVRESYYYLCTHYDEKCKSPEDVIARFKKEGITHVLHAITTHTSKVLEKAGPFRIPALLANPQSRDRFFRLVHRQKFEGVTGERVEYLLYAL